MRLRLQLSLLLRLRLRLQRLCIYTRWLRLCLQRMRHRLQLLRLLLLRLWLWLQLLLLLRLLLRLRRLLLLLLRLRRQVLQHLLLHESLHLFRDHILWQAVMRLLESGVMRSFLRSLRSWPVLRRGGWNSTCQLLLLLLLLLLHTHRLPHRFPLLHAKLLHVLVELDLCLFLALPEAAVPPAVFQKFPHVVMERLEVGLLLQCFLLRFAPRLLQLLHVLPERPELAEDAVDTRLQAL